MGFLPLHLHSAQIVPHRFWIILDRPCHKRKDTTVLSPLCQIMVTKVVERNRWWGVVGGTFQVRKIVVVELRRLELLTPCLQSRCSPNWATAPLIIVFNNCIVTKTRNCLCFVLFSQYYLILNKLLKSSPIKGHAQFKRFISGLVFLT